MISRRVHYLALFLQKKKQFIPQFFLRSSVFIIFEQYTGKLNDFRTFELLPSEFLS